MWVLGCRVQGSGLGVTVEFVKGEPSIPVPVLLGFVFRVSVYCLGFGNFGSKGQSLALRAGQNLGLRV